MTKIALEDIKALREKTHAPMSDCKSALEAVGGDLEKAVDELRKKGLALMVKRGDKEASQGLVGAYASGAEGVLVEVRAETDFVARNDKFQKFVDDMTELAFEHKCQSAEDLEKVIYAGDTVKAALADLVGSIRENITFGRVKYLSVKSGSVGSYVHDKASMRAGRIGVLVAISAPSCTNDLEDLAKKMAMHVAASKPVFCFDADVDQDSIAREKALAEERARESGKPEHILPKIIEGRMAAYMDTVVFARQSYLFDSSKTVMESVSASQDGARLEGFASLAIKGS